MKRLFRRIYRMFNPRKRYYNKVTFKDIDEIYRELYKTREDVRSLAHSVKRQKVQGIYMDEKDAKKYKDSDFICN